MEPFYNFSRSLLASLAVCNAHTLQVAQGSPGHLPTDRLRTDQLVQRLVALFARHPPQHSGTACAHGGGSGGEEKNCNLHVPCCRSILRVIMDAEPNFRRTVAQRKRALDRYGNVYDDDDDDDNDDSL